MSLRHHKIKASVSCPFSSSDSNIGNNSFRLAPSSRLNERSESFKSFEQLEHSTTKHTTHVDVTRYSQSKTHCRHYWKFTRGENIHYLLASSHVALKSEHGQKATLTRTGIELSPFKKISTLTHAFSKNHSYSLKFARGVKPLRTKPGSLKDWKYHSEIALNYKQIQSSSTTLHHPSTISKASLSSLPSHGSKTRVSKRLPSLPKPGPWRGMQTTLYAGKESPYW